MPTVYSDKKTEDTHLKKGSKRKRNLTKHAFQKNRKNIIYQDKLLRYELIHETDITCYRCFKGFRTSKGTSVIDPQFL